jgi:hypothetical protein
MEVECIGFAEDAAGLTEFEDTQSTAGFEHTVEFTQASFIVGEIAETERGDDKVE